MTAEATAQVVADATTNAPTRLAAEPGASEIEWVHADAAFVMVNKPGGLPSVPGRGEHLRDCMAARVQARFSDALVVHRLDMATSGLMLLARGLNHQRLLSAGFANRRIDKRYVAVVHGRVALPAGEIDLPLSADWPNRPRQRVDLAAGKPSLTHYTVLSFDAARQCTRLELRPVTGRSHQLRVHLQALGHPILGDTLYAPPHVQALSTRLLLHAQALAFAHPVTGEPLRFEAPAPF